MARKKTRRRRSTAGRTTKCATVYIKGQGRRKICRDARGRITSNRKA